MSQPGLSVIVDTNAFLHLRDFKDLPLFDLLPGHDWIEIVVIPAVISELDRKKDERSNQRVRNRSRSALDLIEQAASAFGHRLVLRDQPKLTVRPDNSPQPDWSALPTLNSASTDDQLVAFGMSFDGPCVLFSYDRGPGIRARLNNLRVAKAPDDWHLPRQEDESQRELQRLHREVAEERSKRPRITASFVGESGEAVHIREVRILKPPQMTPDQAAFLAGRHTGRHPRAYSSGGNREMEAVISAAFMLGPTAEQLAGYRQAYDEFAEALTQHFLGLHESVHQRTLGAVVEARISNDSSHTASKVIVSLSAPDAVLLTLQSKWPFDPSVSGRPPGSAHRR